MDAAKGAVAVLHTSCTDMVYLQEDSYILPAEMFQATQFNDI
jgi:hypothetical protein